MKYDRTYPILKTINRSKKLHHATKKKAIRLITSAIKLDIKGFISEGTVKLSKAFVWYGLSDKTLKKRKINPYIEHEDMKGQVFWKGINKILEKEFEHEDYNNWK